MNFHHLSLTSKSAEFYFKINIPNPTAIPKSSSYQLSRTFFKLHKDVDVKET